MLHHTIDRSRDQLVVTLRLDLPEALSHVLQPDLAPGYVQRVHRYMHRLEQHVLSNLEILASEVEEGEVKFFRDDLGYGFIRGYDQQDIFVHRRQVRMDGYKTLQPKQRVRFKRSWGRETFEALDVQPIDTDPTP